LVVHGVGDTEPGATLDALLPSLATVADADFRLSGAREVLWLPGLSETSARRQAAEAHDRGGKLVPHREAGGVAPAKEQLVELFPAHVRRAEGAWGSATFAEVYWADLARTRRGALYLVMGLVRLYFGLRHIADQAAAQPVAGGRLLRSLFYLIGFLLRGPLLAAVAFLALAYSAAVPRALTGKGFHLAAPAGPSEAPDLIAFALLGLACLGGGVAWWRAARARRPSAAFWGSLAVTGGLAVSLVGAWLALPRPWLLLLWRLSFRSPPGARPFFELLAQFSIFSTLLSYASHALVLFAVVVWAFCWLRAPRGLRPPLAAAGLACLLPYNWFLALEIIVDALALAVTDPGMISSATRELVFELGLQVLASLCLLGGILMTFGYQQWWAARHPDGGGAQGGPPRLLVGPVPFLLFLVSVLYALLFSFLFRPIPFVPLEKQIWAFADISYWLPFWAGVVVAALLLLVVVPLLYTFLLGGDLRGLLHIVMDVEDHFSRPWPPFPWREGTEERKSFDLRCRIEWRFRCALDELLKDPEITHLAVVAHSQGTVIAVSVLAEAATAEKARGLREVRLLTMGSPFSHLYQHYFPRQYPPLDDGQWGSLKSLLTRWVNIYRVDDFVGTKVAGRHGWPIENVGVAAGGHTNYWRQPSVLRLLSEWLPVPRGVHFRCLPDNEPRPLVVP
jgi:hypothetical protein